MEGIKKFCHSSILFGSVRLHAPLIEFLRDISQVKYFFQGVLLVIVILKWTLDDD